MKCPKCKADTSVKDSRDHKLDHNETTRRRRRCKKCGHRFSTVEILWEPLIKSVGLPKYAPVAGYKTKTKDLPKSSPRYEKHARRRIAMTEQSRQQSSFIDADFDDLSDEALEQAVFEGRVNAD